MARFLPSTLLALAALLWVNSASAQQFLLPYNPDENADGLIGVADLQGLLALYNTEFSAAVVSEDGEDAIVYVGNMAYPVCAQSCKALPGMWHLPTIEDLRLVWDDLFQGVTYTWVNEFDRVQNTLSTSSSVPAAVYFSTSTRTLPFAAPASATTASVATTPPRRFQKSTTRWSKRRQPPTWRRPFRPWWSTGSNLRLARPLREAAAFFKPCGVLPNDVRGVAGSGRVGRNKIDASKPRMKKSALSLRSSIARRGVA